MFFITHIDKFFHNSPGAEMCLGTPHFIEQNLCKKISYRSEQVPLNISKKQLISSPRAAHPYRAFYFIKKFRGNFL